MPHPSDYYAPWIRQKLQEQVLAHYERRLAEYAATIADLRDRLRVLEPMVCEGCGCAAATHTVPDVSYAHWLRRGRVCCHDCRTVVVAWEWWNYTSRDVMAACISVGLRALCGRKLLDGC